MLADGLVDRVLREERGRQRSRRRRQQRHDRERGPRFVRLGQPGELAMRRRVRRQDQSSTSTFLTELRWPPGCQTLTGPSSPTTFKVHARAAPPGWEVLAPPATRGRRYPRKAPCPGPISYRWRAPSRGGLQGVGLARASTASANCARVDRGRRCRDTLARLEQLVVRAACGDASVGETTISSARAIVERRCAMISVARLLDCLPQPDTNAARSRRRPMRSHRRGSTRGHRPRAPVRSRAADAVRPRA